MDPIVRSGWSRLGLCVVALIIAVFALSPPEWGLHLTLWDKLDHAGAFLTLTLLSSVAFPKTPLIWIGLAMLLTGAAIELIQTLPIVRRDGSLGDWIADSVGTAVGLALVFAWKRLVRTRRKPSVSA